MITDEQSTFYSVQLKKWLSKLRGLRIEEVRCKGTLKLENAIIKFNLQKISWLDYLLSECL